MSQVYHFIDDSQAKSRIGYAKMQCPFRHNGGYSTQTENGSAAVAWIKTCADAGA